MRELIFEHDPWVTDPLKQFVLRLRPCARVNHPDRLSDGNTHHESTLTYLANIEPTSANSRDTQRLRHLARLS